jgi:penicillin-binding protein 1A
MRTKRRPLLYVTWALLVVLGVAAGVAVQRLWMFRGELERLASRLTLDVGPESTLIYDANNNLVSALFEEHRIGVRLEEISPQMLNAILAIEDKRFYDHDGIDVRRIIQAAIVNVRRGEIVQGGSTITQQLVRSILLTREQNYLRKLKEAILARRLEERYAKNAILEAYLNRVYFGDGYYGVEAAAIGYFGKSAAELSAVEAATLAGLIKGPSLYSPTKAPELARQRRDLVLAEMRAEGMISDQEYQNGVSVPVTASITRAANTGLTDPRHVRGAEYFRDTVAKELLARFGSDVVYTGGLRVYTTLDRRLQTIAEDVVASRLSRMPAARGGKEPLQGALVAIEPTTGFVKAIVGGRDFKESPYNRAIDAKRQPGSAFKPFIFAQALESGFSTSTMLENLGQPIDTQQGPWLPGGDHEVDAVRLRDALVVSSNRAAAHLLQQVGVRRTIDLVSRFGINSPMPAVPSLALGTGEVSLFELTSAYGVFANRGVWRMPTTIRMIVDRYGREIYRAPNTERPVISEATAYLMTSMMADVMDRGTATAARATGFKLAAAGKTGTSNDYTDAWFVGYTPQLVTGVWFGFDKPRMIMNRGFASVVAVPAWARFMMAATKGEKSEWFEMPGSLVKVKLCRISGLLATERCHLPVHEHNYDPDNPDPLAATQPIAKAGGVYQELRNVSRMPEPCPLMHSETDPSYIAPDAFRAALPDVPGQPPGSAPMSGTPVPAATSIMIRDSATMPPASMTQPRRPTPVETIYPSNPAAAPSPAATPVTAPRETTAKPAPSTETNEQNPIVPGTKVDKPKPEADPAQPAPVIPGSTMTNTPPPAPKPSGNRPPDGM